MSNKKYALLAAIIISVASIVALASVWHDSPIVDEVPHIGAGYSYIAGQTYQFNPEHPPLAKDLAGLALLPLGIPSSVIAAVLDGNWSTNVNDQWNFGRALIYHSGTDPIAIVHAAKLSLILLFIFSGLLIFIWTRTMYGPRAALLAVFLFAFCPTIIAHSRFVTTDMAALFGVLFATYFFIRYLNQPTTAHFWLAVIAFGIALLTKFSTFLLVPYFVLLALNWAWIHHHHYARPAFNLVIKSILIMAVGFFIIVGPIYELHIINYPAIQQKTDTTELLGSYSNRVIADIIIWAADKPILRPFAQYGLGLAMVSQRAEGGNRSYFLGQVSNKSFKSYFPIVYALKEPIPFLILLICAIWFSIGAWLKAREPFKVRIKDHFPEYAMLLWIVIYLTASINANLNIGIRHLLPIYGFIFILTAGQIEELVSRIKYQVSGSQRSLIRNTKYLILVGLFVWYLAEFISIYPSYLSYFNEFALLRPSWAVDGQAGLIPGGHNYVVDSNLDWGQDLWRLADYVKQQHISKINLDYFGWAEQSFYLGDTFIWMQSGQYTNAEQFFKDNPAGGWLAVSATYYQESLTGNHNYSWLTQYIPTAVIGNSIFVWHITP